MRTWDQIIPKGMSEPIFYAAIKDSFKNWSEWVHGKQIKDFHMNWFNAIQNNDRVAITAPTGFGKTEILGISYITWRAWHEKKKDFMIVAKALPQSTKILSRIKEAIEENDMLKELMPNNITKANTWTKTEIKLNTGCSIFCKPYSENLKSYHVDFILADEAASYIDHSIFFRFLITRVNAKRGKIVAISTPEDITDLMQLLSQNSNWVSFTYRAILQDGSPLWPERFSLAVLNRIRMDNPAAFEKEYMCNPRAQADNALYPPHLVEECFDYESSFTNINEANERVFLGCDFAISDGPTSDFDAYVVVGRIDGKVKIKHGEIHKGLSVTAKSSRIQQLMDMYKCERVYIDESHIGSAVLEKLRNNTVSVTPVQFDAMNRNKMLIAIREMIDDKRLIIPRNVNDNNTIVFTNRLVAELLSFKEEKSQSSGFTTYKSKSAHDDTVMALALACKATDDNKDFLDCIAF